ncbi:MAG: hypothetical protein ABFD83_02200 [Armatimonadota bacterium]
MISQKDREILRDLAKRVADIAGLPIMAQRRESWKKHHGLQRVRPMLLVFPERSWIELVPEESLTCRDEAARGYERSLRQKIYYHENIFDDTVIEQTFIVPKAISNTGWGLESQWTASDSAAGAGTFKPVIESQEDLKKLKFPKVIHDEAESMRRLQEAQDLFGDILDVRLKGIRTVSFHMMNIYTHLRGLERVMMDMYEEPEMLHEAMSFLEQGYHKLIDQYVDMNLLSLNDDDAWIYPGGNGYSGELPPAGYDPAHILPRDMWATAEAQELTIVSPEMTYEFAIQYEKRLLERFGISVYGCCEDITRKLNYVFEIANLRQVNISPFADVDKCAENFRKDIIFSWKPHPSALVGDFDEKYIRENIRHALDVTKNLVMEIVLKDTHTCENHPERFTRWTRIAREVIEEYS